jgi:hypothetical protein
MPGEFPFGKKSIEGCSLRVKRERVWVDTQHITRSKLSERHGKDRTKIDKSKEVGINEQGNLLCLMIMSEIIGAIKRLDTSPEKIRDFGITFLVVFAIIGGILLYKGRSVGYAGFGVGVLFAVLGKWAPGSLKAFYRAWMALSLVIGFFMSRLILCMLYYCVLTPIGIIMRLLGKDLLDQRWDKETQSYWIEKEKKAFDKEQYRKLY